MVGYAGFETGLTEKKPKRQPQRQEWTLDDQRGNRLHQRVGAEQRSVKIHTNRDYSPGSAQLRLRSH
jgi:hypothetical protein